MSASVAVAGLMATGTGTALLRKVLFQMDGTGLHGNVHSFAKAWFTTWESAAACWFSILIFWAMRGLQRRARPAARQEQEPLLGAGDKQAEEALPPEEQLPPYTASWREIGALSVPGIFSVGSIIVQGMGLRYVSASVSMMLSGCCIVFTAVLSVLLLKCRLSHLHLTGIALTLVGIVIVSSANLIWPEASHSTHHHPGHPGAGDSLFPAGGYGGGLSPSGRETLWGILLTIASTLILALRLVAEEFALQGTRMHPLQVLGYEGMWGTLAVGLLGLPLAALLPGGDVGGCEENTADSLAMLWANPGLNAVNFAFFLCVVGLNVFGLLVTTSLGSVFRAVLLTARTASVWAADLALFYAHVAGGAVGEPWINPGSGVQLAGFGLLLLGTILYAQGSSVVAIDEEQQKLCCADDSAAEPLSPAALEAQQQPQQGQQQPGELGLSNVSRLRPYTSLYIPHGRRELQRSRSLPFPGLAGASPPGGSPPGGGASGAFLQHHSYAGPSGLVGASPRSIASDDSSADRGLFLRSLTHRSSWVLPPGGRLAGESAPPGPQAQLPGRRASLESDDGAPSAARHGAPATPPAADADSRGGGLPEVSGPEAAGGGWLEGRRSSRRPPAARMPAVDESHAEEDASAAAGPARLSPGLHGGGGEDTSPRHVFGQSPVPRVLLQRRSLGRRRSSPLPAFAEAQEEDAGPAAGPSISRPADVGHSAGRAGGEGAGSAGGAAAAVAIRGRGPSHPAPGAAASEGGEGPLGRSPEERAAQWGGEAMSL